MKTKQEVEAEIKEIKDRYRHVLTGSLATVTINAPRALEQISAETRLTTLYWMLGTEYKSKLKGVDR